MKKLLLIAFIILGFGITKAHMPKKVHPCFTQNKFVVTGINRLREYDVTFRFYMPVKIYKRNPSIILENKFAVEVNRTAITSSVVEKDVNGFARRKLVI